MDEIWATSFTCDSYEVSSLGRIRSKSTGEVRKLQNKHGHWRVNLIQRGKTTGVTVGKEVLSTFHRPPTGVEFTRHINGDCLDNNLNNLEWTEDNAHRVPGAMSSRAVSCVNLKTGKTTEYESALQLAEALGVKRSEVYDSMRVRVSKLDDYEISYATPTPAADAEIGTADYGGQVIFASSDGFVRDQNSVVWKEGGVEQGRDYKRVTFQFNEDGDFRNSSHFDVHRVVARAFYGPPPPHMIVDHIDEDKLNNHLLNLQYITRSENQKKTQQTPPGEKKTYKYYIGGKFTGDFYTSSSEAARSVPGGGVGAISMCCSGKRLSYKKFEWSHMAPPEYSVERDAMQASARAFNKEIGRKNREKKGPVKSTGKPIYAYDKDTLELHGSYPSQKAAAEDTKCDKANISSCVNGKIDKTGGFIFSRLDEEAFRAEHEGKGE